MDPSARDSPLLAQPFPAFNLTTLEDPSRVVDESLFKDRGIEVIYQNVKEPVHTLETL